MPDKNLDRERILVCVSASPTSSDVIRRAAKLSKSTGAELIALYVEDSESQDDAQEKTVHGHLNMAERLGAVITTVYGNDPATAIAQYARVSGITKIVLGKSPGKRSFFAREETLMSRLNELAPDVEIIIVPNHLQEDARHFSLRRKLLKEQFTMGDLVKTVLILVLCTGVGFLFSAIGLAITNVVLIYILGVMAVALFTTGYIYSLLSSLLSVLIFNFFFTEPYYSLQSSPDYFATFAVMFAVAILSSSLTSRIKTQSIQTANKAYQTEVLLSTSQLLQKAEDKEAILNVMLQQLCRLLEHSVLYYDRTDGILAEQPVLHEIESDHGFSQVDFPAERDVVEWVGRNGKHAGRSTRKWPQARCLYMAIRGENRVWAVVGIRADNSPSIDEYRKNLMISILDECALALEKDSHDLRTPLTSISGNAAILLEDLGDLDDSRKKALYASIYDDAIWLNGLMENLLTITRTENETVKLNLQSEMVSDAIEEALRHLDRNAARRRIVVTLEDDLLMARMDSALIVQVLINLINNAVKYTPENAGITIGAKPEGNMVVLWVEDEGPGIPEGDEEKVFELFYTGVKRSPDSRRGIGLGLALCRSIVQAHGGEIKVSNIQPHGARFEFTLPIAEVEEYEQ